MKRSALIKRAEELLAEGKIKEANEIMDKVEAMDRVASSKSAKSSKPSKSKKDDEDEEEEDGEEEDDDEEDFDPKAMKKMFKSVMTELNSLKSSRREVARPLFAFNNQEDGSILGNREKSKESGIEVTAKRWYQRKHGDIDAAVETFAKDLYGMSYQEAAYRKNRAMKHWIRTGRVDDRGFDTLVLYSPEQIIEEIMMDGDGVRAFKAVQVESQDTLGGFSVPEDFRTNVIERLPGFTVIRSRAKVQPTSRDVLSMLKRTGGNSRYIGAARVKWTDETPPSAAYTQTNATYGKISIPVNVVMANVPLSRSFLEDAAVDPVEYVRKELVIAMALDEDEKFLTGDGNGVPEGILSGIGANQGPNDSDVTVFPSGTFSAFSADNIVMTPMKLDSQYRQLPGCVWIGAKDTYASVYSMKDSQGRFLWANNMNNLSEGYQQTLRGFEIAESEAMPALGTNTYPLVFGNVAEGYMIADRVGMSLERYQDSNTVDKDTVIFYARRRLGGQTVAGWAFVAVKAGTAV